MALLSGNTQQSSASLAPLQITQPKLKSYTSFFVAPSYLKILQDPNDVGTCSTDSNKSNLCNSRLLLVAYGCRASAY
jgi:hypothetical protein